MRARLAWRLRPLPLAVLLLMLGPGGAWALGDPLEMLANPKLEARAEAIGGGLRCVVCQNESIEASGAPLARDLRAIIRQQVTEGRSNQQIRAYMVARYGDFILLRPPFDALTALLWTTPLLALALGLLAAVLGYRWQQRRSAPPPPLSPTERARVDRLLRS